MGISRVVRTIRTIKTHKKLIAAKGVSIINYRSYLHFIVKIEQLYLNQIMEWKTGFKS